MQAEAVHFLLKWGADCKLKDHDGVSPIDTARHFPEILAAMHQQQVLAKSYTLCSGYRLYSQSVWLAASCLPLVTCPCCSFAISRDGDAANTTFSVQKCHCLDKLDKVRSCSNKGSSCRLQLPDTQRSHTQMLQCLQGTYSEAEQRYSHKCGQCGKPGAVKRCSKCRLSTYCSSECQKEHWYDAAPAACLCSYI